MEEKLYRKISKVTLGKQQADLVLKNLKLVDVFTGEIVESNVAVKDGLIAGVSRSYRGKKEIDLNGQYLAPGFIDAHLHLESTMVTPNELVTAAALRGTTTFIVDPHEAANVSGAAGIDYILKQTEYSPANVYVMMPSCVPATQVDDNGGIFSANDMYPYLGNPRILGLGEVMDDPAVIRGDENMFSKLALFENRVIDGHAPYLPNRELSAYKMAGIDTDHEADSFEYALEEARRGIHVHIREGSAAHNLRDIVEGIVRTGIDTEYFSFCTDDKHIEDILRDGHIGYSVKLAVSLGLDPIKAIKMATINAAKCYGLKHLGAISPGFQADFVVLDNLEDLNVTAVFHRGKQLDPDAPVRVLPCKKELKHTVHLSRMKPEQFVLPIQARKTHVIGIDPGQITTRDLQLALKRTENYEPEDGLAKVAAVERHHNTGKIGTAVVSGYGIRGGAVASSVSHDSHNIVVVGDNDRDMAIAVNEIIRTQGGYTLIENGRVYETLPLPVMGLMSDAGFPKVNESLHRMIKKAHEMGVLEGIDPFITLSFLALPVIPSLRITPRGLCRMTAGGPEILE